jgi:hypothetical protein
MTSDIDPVVAVLDDVVEGSDDCRRGELVRQPRR